MSFVFDTELEPIFRSSGQRQFRLMHEVVSRGVRRTDGLSYLTTHGEMGPSLVNANLVYDR